MCRVCRRKTQTENPKENPKENPNSGDTSMSEILTNEVSKLKQMLGFNKSPPNFHLYLLTSPAHELLQKFKVGITKGTLEELVNEFKPYMMEVTVYRFNKITNDANSCLTDLYTNLSQYKCDQAGWFESKKDVIMEIFDAHVRETYSGSDQHFIADLVHLGQAVANAADKLELRMKLERLNESGKNWLKILDI